MGVMVKNKVARFLWTTVYICVEAEIARSFAVRYRLLFVLVVASS